VRPAAVAILAAALALGAAAEETPPAGAPHHHHEGHTMAGMDMDAGGMVMNQNTDQLPRDCAQVSRDVKLTVRAGRKFAAGRPGTMYGYDQPAWSVPGCARVTVTLVNEDHVRHQWMLHGLPRYLYPEGMFHLEVSGPGERSGTFIVPSAPKTYLVHCDVPQHTEKGMKAELVVAGGAGDLASIPGLTSPVLPDRYAVRWTWRAAAALVAGALAGVAAGALALRRPS
jgi:hypothetical protein